MEWISFIKDITVTYWGGFGFPLLFFIAALAVFILEKDRIKRYSFFWYSFLALFLIYNPLTLVVIKKLLTVALETDGLREYYFRLFSLIPIIPLIAYGLTLIISKLEGLKKLVATVVAIGLIIVTGTCLYTQDWFTKADNRNKVPQDVVTICDIFKDYQGDKIRIMSPQSINVYLRQMDSRFSMPYGRVVPDEALELTAEKPNVQAVLDYAKENDVEYVVVWAAEDTLNAFLNYGFKLYGRTANYAVMTAYEPTWIMTEYAMTSGDQGIFYTVENTSQDKLIVIDGGDAKNEQLVRDTIMEKGGVVDAWIITHYHQDHVDSFNKIFADPQGITIKTIYATPLDSETFHSVAQEWDDVKSYDTFMSLTRDSLIVKYLSRDAKLQFEDLTITFFNAYDSVVKDYGYDIPNNDSLVFKLETANRSALIMADCHDGYMAEYFMDRYGSALQSDILQVAHHGNNSTPTETGFYEVVSPEVAVFDTPTEIMTSANYTAGVLAAYLQEKGIRIIWYNTAPNIFGL